MKAKGFGLFVICAIIFAMVWGAAPGVPEDVASLYALLGLPAGVGMGIGLLLMIFG